MNNFLKNFIDQKFDKSATALDLGAGEFEDVNSLIKIGWKCEGVDLKIGVDLEKPYLSKNAPFDLVFSNYTLHKIVNKKEFINTIYNNLKKGGWFFIHSFDKSDKNSKSGLDEKEIKKLFEVRFENIKTRIIDFYDDDEGHRHWHRILEMIGQKK